ncbi:MAG: hypothetical protein DGJ47_000026 [Rickettsiaceae bacterium]
MIKKIAVALVALTMVSGCGYVSKDYRHDAEHLMYFQEHVGDTVWFDLNSSSINKKSAKILAEQSSWLMEHDKYMAVVEGHCDERGTGDYNLALGARRAESIKAKLVEHGIAADRISTISYGKTKPVDAGHNEEAWAKNRRGVLVIK